MNNDITKLLNIEDNDINIIDIYIEGSIKYIVIEKKLKTEYCPRCHSRMHSRGIYKRTVNHPVLQDGYQLKIIVRQRKWKCINPDCNLYFNDHFNFVDPYRQSSNMTDLLILRELKNISLSIVYVAQCFNVSDTYVHYILRQYLDIQRLPLTDIICVDEVHLDIDYRHKYALVIFDFRTGRIIDILPNRWEETTNTYFLSIPLEERKKVKHIICDMYNPYVNFASRYFPESTASIDSFHVISWLLKKLGQYINGVKKKYQERDKENYIQYLKENNKYTGEPVNISSVPVSDEVYLLNNFRWLILVNQSKIEYEYRKRFNHKLKMYLNTYDYEKMFFALDENFRKIRDLKEEYIEFNSTVKTDINVISRELDDLITKYSKSEYWMFRDFSKTLKKYRQEIINSFSYIKDGEKTRRLSNGPIEAFNREVKDCKRSARGFDNFEAIRIRLIWSNRDDEPILAVPKSKDEVYTFNEEKKDKKKKN